MFVLFGNTATHEEVAPIRLTRYTYAVPAQLDTESWRHSERRSRINGLQIQEWVRWRVRRRPIFLRDSTVQAAHLSKWDEPVVKSKRDGKDDERTQFDV
jgi:hypothetical protein